SGHKEDDPSHLGDAGWKPEPEISLVEVRAGRHRFVERARRRRARLLRMGADCDCTHDGENGSFHDTRLTNFFRFVPLTSATYIAPVESIATAVGLLNPSIFS